MFSNQKSTTKKVSQIAEFIWHDREIRFDVPIAQLSCRPGERIIDSLS
jgi:hypothetical protein